MEGFRPQIPEKNSQLPWISMRSPNMGPTGIQTHGLIQWDPSRIIGAHLLQINPAKFNQILHILGISSPVMIRQQQPRQPEYKIVPTSVSPQGVTTAKKILKEINPIPPHVILDQTSKVLSLYIDFQSLFEIAFHNPVKYGKLVDRAIKESFRGLITEALKANPGIYDILMAQKTLIDYVFKYVFSPNMVISLVGTITRLATNPSEFSYLEPISSLNFVLALSCLFYTGISLFFLNSDYFPPAFKQYVSSAESFTDMMRKFWPIMAFKQYIIPLSKIPFIKTPLVKGNKTN
ncbi:MAG: hypothetical protein QHH09_00100 [Microgenomates group bacterium]|nr:hypothetical protein [Microgenomates group bacterium]